MCWDEQRPGLTLGKLSQVPNGATEHRWQFADSLTYLVPHAAGDHSLKGGVDVSVIGLDARGIDNGDGTFVFQGQGGKSVFNPDLPETYPRLYTRTLGVPNIHLDHTLFSAFLQDRWKPRSNVTLNVGLRWDYDRAPGVSQETRDVAPRVAVAFDPTGRGRTSFRAGFGRYYDQVPLVVATVAEQGSTQVLITNPGYPDPYGPNPNRGGNVAGPPSTTRLADMHVPYTDQFSIGLQRTVTREMALTADVIQARGRDLLVTHDLNYPDPNGTRPDPLYQQVTAVESRGNSWYRGLQIALEKRHSHGHSYTLAYTLSTSERDTEDYTFVPQDQRDFAAERGPAANDVRHRLSAGLNLDLPARLRFTSVLTAQSALPYTITTGRDDNHDGHINDRPSGFGRNSARGTDFRQVDARLSKSFRARGARVEVLVEAFNLANRANWTNYDGNQSSKTYCQPTAALPARQLQVGARIDF
jgi:hypothetical protein